QASRLRGWRGARARRPCGAVWRGAPRMAEGLPRGASCHYSAAWASAAAAGQLLETGGAGGDDLRLGLELALQGCLQQLRALRAARCRAAAGQGGPGAPSASAAAYAAEEQALKLSVSGIVQQLQAYREARKEHTHELLLAVVPQILQLLPTVAALRFSAASAGLRAAGVSQGCGARLVPHLDAAPACPRALRRFLGEVALGSVRSLALPAPALDWALAE
ncbi:unnamed protein product, partial [Prorocentrum cordatum]